MRREGVKKGPTLGRPIAFLNNFLSSSKKHLFNAFYTCFSLIAYVSNGRWKLTSLQGQKLTESYKADCCRRQAE